MISGPSLTSAAKVAWRVAPSVVWAREADCVRVIDQRTNSSWRLAEAQAAIWDLLVLGYSSHKTVAFLSDLLCVPTGQAEDLFQATLCRWNAEGIMEVVRGAGDDEPSDQQRL